jgi:hypothetical protein
VFTRHDCRKVRVENNDWILANFPGKWQYSALSEEAMIAWQTPLKFIGCDLAAIVPFDGVIIIHDTTMWRCGECMDSLAAVYHGTYVCLCKHPYHVIVV